MPSSAPKSSKIFSSSLKWLGLCFVGTLAAVYIVIDTATSEGFVQTLGSATDTMLAWVGLAPDDNTYIEGNAAYEIGKAEEAVLGDEEILGETDSATAPTPVEIKEPLGLVLGEQTSAGVEMIEGNNLLRNSSFEEQEDGAPRQWTYQHTSNLGNSFVDAVYRSGAKGLHLKSNTANSNGNYGVSQPDIKLKGGRAYTFSAYVKPIGVSGVTVRLTFWDSVGNKRALTKDFSFSGDKEWTRVSLSIDNYNTYVGDQYFPMIEVMGLTAGSLYIDDAQLQEGTVLGIYRYGDGSAGALYGGGGSAIGDGSVLVSNGGIIYPAVNGTGSLGSSNNKFEELHLSNASIDDKGGLTVGGVVTQGTITTDSLYVTSGTLGVGTTAPSTALHVVGTTTYENTSPTDIGCIRYSGASMQYSNNCTAFTDFSASAAGGWTTATTRVWNTDLLTDIGIGLSDPAAKLEIQVGSTEAVTAVLIDQNDLDKISLQIVQAANATANALDISSLQISGNVLDIDWSVAETQADAALAGIAVDFTNFTPDDNKALYGLHINDAASAGVGALEYAIYQQGGNWDFGLYVEDDTKFLLPSASKVLIDADTTNTEVTAGVLDINVGTTADDAVGVHITLQNDDDSVATTAYGMVINIDNNATATDDTVYGLFIDSLSNGGTDTDLVADALIVLDNSDATTADLVDDGILFTSAGGAFTDAIDVSATQIINAINFGANTILGTTGAIDMTYFDVAATTGAVTLTQQAAGTSPLTITGQGAGTVPAIDIGSSNVGGNIIELDWTNVGTTQTAALAGMYINMDNLVSNGTNVVYGLHINDIGTTSASVEYGIFQEGNDFDIGIMAQGGLAIGAQQTLPDSATPLVTGGSHYTTGAARTNSADVTDFLGGVTGQLLVIESGTTNPPTYDCAGSEANINCGSLDIGTSVGCVTTWVHDGTVWNLISWMNADEDQLGTDIAEYMKSDQNLEAGTVVVAHPNKAEHVVRSEYGYDSRVIGIVADKDGVLGNLTPGVLMGNPEYGTPVTLAGRVWAKFDDQNGDVAPGDALTSAPDGKLMKAVKAGPMVGKAFSVNVDGYVITLINMGWFNPAEVALGDLIALPDNLDELELLAGLTSADESEEVELLAALGGDEADEADESESVEGDVLGATDELEVLKEKTLNELTVTDSAVFEGTVTVASLDVSGMVIVAGDVRVGGDLQVAGALVSEFTAGQALSTGDAVAVSGANTVVRAYSTSNMPAIGVVVGGAGEGSTVRVAISGKVSGYGGLAVGSRYYVGSAGVVQAGAPEEGKKQVIGVAVSSGTLLVMPSLTYDDAEEVVVEESVVESVVEEPPVEEPPAEELPVEEPPVEEPPAEELPVEEPPVEEPPAEELPTGDGEDDL